MGRINLSHWAIRHPALIAFLILAIGIGGALAYFQLGRAEDPSFTIKNVNVSAIWPGATTQEMQDQVTDRIEKKLRELAYFDKSTTYTKPGFTSIGIDFKDSTPARLVPMLFIDLRKKLGDMRGDLPADLVGPIVNDEFGDVDAVLYTIKGDGASYAQLKEVAEGAAPAPAARARRHQGRSLRRSGAAHFRRIQPCQAGDARRADAGLVRFARQAERGQSRRRIPDRRPARARARDRRAGRRRRRRRDAGLRQWRDVPPRRHRRRHAWL